MYMIKRLAVGADQIKKKEGIMKGIIKYMKGGQGDSWGGYCFFPDEEELRTPDRHGFSLSGRGFCLIGDMEGQFCSAMSPLEGQFCPSMNEDDSREAEALREAGEGALLSAYFTPLRRGQIRCVGNDTDRNRHNKMRKWRRTKMEKILNMTPHPVNLITGNGTITLPSAGQIRLASQTVPAGEINGIPLTRTEFGVPEGLPQFVEGTYYIVSQLVKSALPERIDLLVPAEVVRDDQGRIVGCRSLGR